MPSFVALSLAAAICSTIARGDTAPGAIRPGALGNGVTLLPNGWKIAPAGRHVQVGDLPLAMLESPDGRALLVANNGFAKPTISVVDLQNQTVSSASRLG